MVTGLPDNSKYVQVPVGVDVPPSSVLNIYLFVVAVTLRKNAPVPVQVVFRLYLVPGVTATSELLPLFICLMVPLQSVARRQNWLPVPLGVKAPEE